METQRFVKLETTIAFQEERINKLEEVVSLQQLELHQLEERIERLRKQLLEVSPSLLSDLADEPPPPHY
jgi:SlyX protein